jgi:NAD+ synthase (glutamine-hydrolysing)
MKIALAQINPTVGDLEGNARRIEAAAARAQEAGATLVVLPELALTGYPPRDLLEQPRFILRTRRTLERLAARTGPMAAVVAGFVAENPAPRGRRLLNAAAFLQGGQVVRIVPKSLLPTYDVFDEARHFEPGRETAPVEIDGLRLGITICEDVWVEAPPPSEPGRAIVGEDAAMLRLRSRDPARLYDADPAAVLVAAGARLLLNISASPYEKGKPERRRALMAGVAARHHVPLLMVNQVGGNDELIFDGHSAAFDATGQLRLEAAGFAEDFQVVDLDHLPPALPVEPVNEIADLHSALVLGLRDYCRKCGFTDVTIGLSGGIDSSVVGALAAEALGPARVLGVAMPGPFSAPESEANAARLARNLGLRFAVIPIVEVFQAYLGALAPHFAGRPFDVAEENLQARIRGNFLMALSNKFGYLVLSPGNKSELATGYCTLYGDMSGGLAVISDVVKTDVYALARYINREREIIPPHVLARAPTAELRPNQTDQDTLPPYEVLDPIIRAYIEDSLSAEEIAQTGVDAATVQRVLRMIDRNEYKRRQAAPGLRVTPKAFGVGRRMPIAAKYVQ